MEARVRLLRTSLLLQTKQGQPMTGTPVEVPEPNIITFTRIAPSSACLKFWTALGEHSAEVGLNIAPGTARLLDKLVHGVELIEFPCYLLAERL